VFLDLRRSHGLKTRATEGTTVARVFNPCEHCRNTYPGCVD